MEMEIIRMTQFRPKASWYDEKDTERNVWVEEFAILGRSVERDED